VELARTYAGFREDSAEVVNGFMAAHAAPPSLSCHSSQQLACEGAVIKLQDRWAHFCRELVLNSAVGAVRTTQGNFIVRRFGTEYEALKALRATFTGKSKKRPDWEPRWFDPGEAIDAAQRLRVVNFGTVSAALGSTPSPLDDLRAVRNFFAHRGKLAGSTARVRLGLCTTADLHSYLAFPLLGGALRFESWVLTLQIIARAAVN
jgi:hypothetical protein